MLARFRMIYLVAMTELGWRITSVVEVSELMKDKWIKNCKGAV